MNRAHDGAILFYLDAAAARFETAAKYGDDMKTSRELVLKDVQGLIKIAGELIAATLKTESETK